MYVHQISIEMYIVSVDAWFTLTLVFVYANSLQSTNHHQMSKYEIICMLFYVHVWHCLHRATFFVVLKTKVKSHKHYEYYLQYIYIVWYCVIEINICTLYIVHIENLCRPNINRTMLVNSHMNENANYYVVRHVTQTMNSNVYWRWN